MNPNTPMTEWYRRDMREYAVMMRRFAAEEVGERRVAFEMHARRLEHFVESRP